MKKLILTLLLMLTLTLPSFARGLRIQIFLPPLVFGDEPYCSTPYIYQPPVYYPPQYPVYGYPTYQPVFIFQRHHFINYGGRIIR